MESLWGLCLGIDVVFVETDICEYRLILDCIFFTFAYCHSLQSGEVLQGIDNADCQKNIANGKQSMLDLDASSIKEEEPFHHFPPLAQPNCQGDVIFPTDLE